MDNKFYSIRQNLEQGLHALWSYRQVNSDGIAFWADAVYIDQRNVFERTYQVNMESGIYTAYVMVGLCLGPVSDDSNKAIDFISNPEANWNRKDYDPSYREIRSAKGDFLDIEFPIQQAIRINDKIERAVIATQAAVQEKLTDSSRNMHGSEGSFPLRRKGPSLAHLGRVCGTTHSSQ